MVFDDIFSSLDPLPVFQHFYKYASLNVTAAAWPFMTDDLTTVKGLLFNRQ